MCHTVDLADTWYSSSTANVTSHIRRIDIRNRTIILGHAYALGALVFTVDPQILYRWCQVLNPFTLLSTLTWNKACAETVLTNAKNVKGNMMD
jgi:hypothetical protein